MRLATKALIAALLTIAMSVAVAAQRSTEDPRNQAPAVGTGGPPGGPTGLFTVFDADTIQRGEFTFSAAYSNYDRDPGNVDIVETPLSFNVGISRDLEIFFKTTGYRGIKVNNPQNLSSFYLPNSQLFFGANLRCSGAAIILAPQRVSGPTIPSGATFRPAGPPCNVGGQPFVQFPFIGGQGPNLGLTGNIIAPPFVSRIGSPFGGSGYVGAAANFPGMGSVVGSILPGIVLTTRVIPPNLTFGPLTVPDLFTIAPAYLPDAPFINRLYGESSFTEFTVGFKVRFTGVNNPLGVAIIPFYRWNLDKANDFSGFNQLQRGASAGANIGDFGLIGAISGRLSKHVNVSANLGYILNTNPKSDAMNKAVLLDRPDEFLAGLGFDFPINKHFQIIAEARSTIYMGGSTPNAFNNNPVDALGGIRIFPARWWGIGVAYRRHMNQQDDEHFDGQLTSVGFKPSDDPNGFIFQLWAGHRNARIPPNVPPTIFISPASATITLPCPPGTSSETCTPSASDSIELVGNGTDTDGDVLVYTWTVNGGTKSSDARTITWTFSEPGTYTATVSVDDGHGHIVASAPVTITVNRCENCVPPKPPCPNVSVSCPNDVPQGSPITYTASVSGGDSNVTPTFNWTVSAGTISSGQGTSSITVDTTGLGGQSVTATVEVGGYEAACPTTGSCTTAIIVPPVDCRKFDEYADLSFNDEKARLDNFAIQLQQEPGSTGYYVIFGSCDTEGAARSERAVDYLVNTRGIDRARITVVNGGCRESLLVELWICPTGAGAPTPTNSATVDPCPTCKPRPRPRRRVRRGRMDE